MKKIIVGLSLLGLTSVAFAALSSSPQVSTTGGYFQLALGNEANADVEPLQDGTTITADGSQDDIQDNDQNDTQNDPQNDSENDNQDNYGHASPEQANPDQQDSD